MEPEGHGEWVCSLIMNLHFAQEPDDARARLPFGFPHKIVALYLLLPAKGGENGQLILTRRQG
jgi:hypothetical protein